MSPTCVLLKNLGVTDLQRSKTTSEIFEIYRCLISAILGVFFLCMHSCMPCMTCTWINLSRLEQTPATQNYPDTLCDQDEVGRLIADVAKIIPACLQHQNGLSAGMYLSWYFHWESQLVKSSPERGCPFGITLPVWDQHIGDNVSCDGI